MRRAFAIAALLAALPAPGLAEERPWIGVALGEKRTGVVVRSTLPASPAAQAGIVAGDEILEVAGKRVGSREEVQAAVGAGVVGDSVAVKLLWGKDERVVAVRLAPRPSELEVLRAAVEGRPVAEFVPRVVSGPRWGGPAASRGEVLLIEFFATWCPTCKVEIPQLARLHARWAKKGLRVVAVSTEEPEVVGATARRARLPFTVVQDQGRAITDRFQVYALPTAVVVDREGVVRRVFVADLDAAAEAALALLGRR